MKRKELVKRWGIVFLSMMVTLGTAAAPSHAVYAAEDIGSEAAAEESVPEPDPQPEPPANPEPPADPEPSADPEPDVEEGGDSGEDGGDDSGTGGGEAPAQTDEGDPEPAGDDGGETVTGSTEGDSSDSAEESTSDSTEGSASDSTEGNTSNSADESTSSGSTEESTTGSTEGSTAGSTEGSTAGSTEGSTAGSTEGSISGTTEDKEQSQISDTGSTDMIAAPEGNTGTTAEKAAEIEPVKVAETDEPEGIKEAENYDGTNEELIAQQHIVTDLPEIRRDFRFTTVDKVLAFSDHELEFHEEQDEDSKVVGTIARNGILYELEDEDNGWIYAESGNARGFVREEDLIRGEDAELLMESLEKQAERISAMLPRGVSKDSYFFTAQETVPVYENEAYAFRRITTRDIVIQGEASLALSDLEILEECSDSARTVGRLSEGGLAYVIEEADDGWLFVESGDVRGFVPADELDRSDAVQEQIDEEGESSLSVAKEVIKPSENKALYYSLLSVKEGAKYNEVREKILEVALSCVGNPYVWGGTSLTHGADCSGFVQTLYRMFGYSLPRVADAQSRVGTQIPVSDAAPGDLIFFARNGYVFHVAMYAGDGKTVEAYSSQYGIITKELSDRDAVWATRIIED